MSNKIVTIVSLRTIKFGTNDNHRNKNNESEKSQKCHRYNWCDRWLVDSLMRSLVVEASWVGPELRVEVLFQSYSLLGRVGK